MIVPSGRVTLAEEALSTPSELAEELAVADDPLDWLAVVFPVTIVDDDTLPEPAVTDDETPAPFVPSVSIIVQVVSSSILISSDEPAEGESARTANSDAPPDIRIMVERKVIAVSPKAGWFRRSGTSLD